MGDIALQWGEFEAVMALASNDIATDEGLQTAVIISLFSDRQAENSDILPEGETYRRGWYGDAVPEIERDKIGSKLWLLSREKQMPIVLRRAEEYATESLQWLIEDMVATNVRVVATNPGMGILHLQVDITRPSGNAVTFRYDYNWNAQAQQGG